MGLLWFLLVVIVVVSVAYTTLRGLRKGRARRSGPSRGSRRVPPTEGETPREALDDRFSEGDLSEDEYQRTRTDLS